MEKVRITMVDYMYSASLHKAVKRVNEVTCNRLDFRFYDVRDVEAGRVDIAAFTQDLEDSDIVLLNIMGGDKISKIVCDTLTKTENTVVVFVGGSSDITNLTRLGSFSFHIMSQMGMRYEKVDYGKILEMRERFEKLGKAWDVKVCEDAEKFMTWTLPSLFIPEKAKGWNRIVQFRLKDAGNWIVEIKDQQIIVRKGEQPNPHIEIKTDFSTLYGIFTGDVFPPAAIEQGKMEAFGSLSDHLRFSKIFKTLKAR